MKSVDVFALPVHPAAEVFPMLSDDELDELAADIKANGQAHAIVIKDGTLIDGRNRREACRRAGVAPITTELNGQDPVAYIVSTNVNRRHMTKGQRAMAVAMIYPEPAKLRRAGSGSSVSEELSGTRVSYARTVLKWAPELAQAVLSGAHPLDKAYDIAADRKTKAEVPARRLQALRAVDPDLADKVQDEQLSLDDAEGASRARRERERVQRQGLYDGLRSIEEWKVLLTGAHLEYLVATCKQHPDELSASDVRALLADIRDLCSKAEEALA